MSDAPPLPPSSARAEAILLALAAAASFSMGVLPLLGLPCERCAGGALSLALPWIGAAFYAGAAVLVRFRPGATLLTAAASIAVFAHADLLGESVRLGRFCWGCLAVAAFAMGAFALRARTQSAERASLAASLLFGVAASFFAPYERVDYALTRLTWPARLLADLPGWVEKDEVFRCDHSAPVRLLFYERDCKACTSASRRLIPRLTEEFGARVCIHPHDLPSAPPGARLPLFVLATPDRRLLAFEGGLSHEELREAVQSMIEARSPRLPMAGPAIP